MAKCTIKLLTRDGNTNRVTTLNITLGRAVIIFELHPHVAVVVTVSDSGCVRHRAKINCKARTHCSSSRA